MKKYILLLKYELKTLIKDSTNIFMILYPFIMLLVLGYLLPMIMKKTQSSSQTILIIGVAIALSIGSFMSGALLAFSLIENRDENTLLSISVTPLAIEGYTKFKLIYSYVFSLISNFIIIGGLKLFFSKEYVITVEDYTISMLVNLSWINILIFILVNSLFTPTIALIISFVAKNKVEGFAFLKAGGLLIIIPILSIMNFFIDGKQYLLGIMPNFWSIKAMLNLAMENNHPNNLPFFVYMVIGAFYSLILYYFTYNGYMKKLKQ